MMYESSLIVIHDRGCVFSSQLLYTEQGPNYYLLNYTYLLVMVLADLGRKITSALHKLNKTTVVDE